MLRTWAAAATGLALALFTRFLTAARAIWDGTDPVARQRIYFANHTSNGDFMLIWTVLPPPLRRQTRPVAAADYWLKNRVREFIGRDVVNAVLVDRRAEHRDSDPIEAMVEALDDGASLIIFPEGKRNTSGEPLLPFKAGLYNMAKARPEIDLVPVWIVFCSDSNWPRAARCFSTRSVRSLQRPSSCCCVSCRRETSSASAAKRHSTPMSG